MTKFLPPVCRIALLAAALLGAAAPQACAAPPRVLGIAVVSDGSTNRSYAPAYEYTSLQFGQGSFGLTLPGGKKVAGLERHIVANYEYGTPPSVGAVAAMEALTRDHVKTAPYLSPRIVRMKEELRKMELEAAIAGESVRKPAAVFAAEMTVKGRILRNIRATALREGKLRFMHDEGVFTLPAEELSEAFLSKVGKSSPDIAATEDFRNLMGTFVNAVTIGGERHTGARIDEKMGQVLTIETGQGLRTVEVSAIDPADLAKLEAAYQRLVKLSGEFKAAREREAKKLAEYVARLEREELERYRREHEAIAEAEGMIGVESKIMAEFERQRGAAGDAESTLLQEMGKLLENARDSGGGFPAPQASGAE
jgi:hypothetical protein